MSKSSKGPRKTSRRRLSTLALANVLIAAGAAPSDAANPPAAGETSSANKPSSDSTESSLGADRLIIQGSALDSYQSSTSANAKYTERLRDTPQTVTVIPQQLIKDENATTLQQALRNVPGITFTAGEGGTTTGDNINIRGFNARQDLFVDGFRDTGVYTRDPFNLEQIEVVEGPASAYSGHGSTGGSVNLITKAPLSTPLYAAEAGFGTDSYYRDTVDVNIPFKVFGGNTSSTSDARGDESKDGPSAPHAVSTNNAAFRLNGLYQYNEFAGRDEIYNKRYGVFPEIGFGIGTKNRFTLSYLYLHESDLPSFGLPILSATGLAANPQFAGNLNRVTPVDYSSFFGLTDRDHQNTDTHIVTFTAAHDFANGFTLANTFRYGQTWTDEITTTPRFDTGLNYRPDGTLAGNFTVATYPAGALTRELRGRRQLDTIPGDQAVLSGKFNTWKFEHSFVVTGEISQERENSGQIIGVNEIASLNNPNPNDAYPFPIVRYPKTRARLDDYAFSLFDSIKLLPQLILSGGMRYDHLESHSALAAYRNINNVAVAAFSGGATNDLASWRTALTYKPIEPVSIYFGYGTSYNPSIEGTAGNTSSPSALNRSTANLEPESNATYEFGVKADVLKDKLALNAAFFRTTKENARIADPSLPTASAVFILAGEVRVQGIELGFHGNLTDKWKVYGGYAYLETEFLDGPNNGKQLPFTPSQSATIFTTYELPYHLTVGVGSQYVDSVYGQVANTSKVPGYHVEQAFIGYQATKNFGIQFNVYNLADKEYIAQFGNGRAVPGTGRSMTCTMRVAF